jgi:ribosomal protein S18 acetylase RimI-like enzyme
VRRCEAHEWRVYRDLRLRALGDAPDAFARTLAEEERRSDAGWAEMLEAAGASSSEACFLAERGGRAVGLAYARLADDASGRAHLHALWVEPAARRSGVGRALAEAAVSWARSRGAARVLLQVTEGNAAAARLYRDLGFEPTDELSPLRPGSPLVVRTLALELRAEPPR